MPFLIPILFLTTGAGIGAYFAAKDVDEKKPLLPQAIPDYGVNPTTVAYYAALGMGLFWLAHKSGVLKTK